MPKMIRPEWDQFIKQTAGAYLACNCGGMLTTLELIREHWQAGHFDYPERKENKPLGILICEALGISSTVVGDIDIFIPPMQQPVDVYLRIIGFEDKLRDIDWHEALKGADVTLSIEHSNHPIRTGYEEFAERVDAQARSLLKQLTPECPRCKNHLYRQMLDEGYVFLCSMCGYEARIPYSEVPPQ